MKRLFVKGENDTQKKVNLVSKLKNDIDKTSDAISSITNAAEDDLKFLRIDINNFKLFQQNNEKIFFQTRR